ncbi:MAG: hypothetical protein ACJ8EL_02960 [Rhizomicrobium sp.]
MKKAVVAVIIALSSAGSVVALTPTAAFAYRYYHHGHWYPHRYHWHGQYYYNRWWSHDRYWYHRRWNCHPYCHWSYY